MDKNAAPDRQGGSVLEAVLDLQSARWGRGERPMAEEFLDRFPALRDTPDAAVDVIYREFLLRKERGENPDPAEYFRRFPFFAELLTRQLAVDEAIRSADETHELPGLRDDGQSRTEPGASTVTDDTGPTTKVPFRFFPGYDFISVIGRGGMGVVYKARHRKLGRVVAIKTVTELEAAQPHQLGRFLDEAQASARLQHPNIVTVHEVGEHDGRPYFALEFVDGADLKKRLDGKPIAPKQAAELVETIARAVHAAHQAGIVHRDLKPSNILLSSAGVPKVADFGLAKLLGSDSGRTESGQVVGTPSYMAPEQAEGRSKQVGPAADVYALGAILYEALAGRPPFLGDTQIETLRLVCSTDPVSLKQLRPDLPRDLETICLKCLEKDPRRRYATAADLADELRRCLECRPIVARPASVPERAVRWCRRNPWVAASLLLLLLGTSVSTWQAIRATMAERRAKKERDRAESEMQIAKAVEQFLNKDLLAQAGAEIQAGPATPPDRDLKVREALDRAAAKIAARFANRPIIEASIRETIGEAYFSLGLYPQALEHLERARTLRRSELGEDHPDTLDTQLVIGTVYLKNGKVAESEPLLTGAMKGLRSALGDENPRVLIATHGVAQLYFMQGKLVEAEKLLISLRDAYQRTPSAAELDALDVANSLAVVYVSEKKFEQAKRLLLDFIKEARARIGDQHPATIAAMSNLALVSKSLGDNTEAARLWNEALEGRRSVLGRKHPETLYSLVVLGEFYMTHGKLDDAEPLLREALEGCRTALDRNHDTTEMALMGLAVVYSSKGELEKLEPVLKEAAQIALARNGPDDGNTGAANMSLATLYLFRRNYAKAEPCLRECVAFWKRNSSGPGNRFYNELQYAECLVAQKDFASAKTHLLAGYNGIRAGHPDYPPRERADLGSLIFHLLRLRDDNGRPLSESVLSNMQTDPGLKAVVLDLQFPDNPIPQP